MPDYHDDCWVEVWVDGIPALAWLTWYEYQPGGAFPCQAQLPEDVYGLEEIEYALYDRKGYFASWLENKVDTDPALEEDVREQISEEMARRRRMRKDLRAEAEADRRGIL